MTQQSVRHGRFLVLLAMVVQHGNQFRHGAANVSMDQLPLLFRIHGRSRRIVHGRLLLLGIVILFEQKSSLELTPVYGQPVLFVVTVITRPVCCVRCCFVDGQISVRPTRSQNYYRRRGIIRARTRYDHHRQCCR
jgi:hypothetical protein